MKRSRTLTRKSYIVEALLEYLVSILVSGTFLSAILKHIGVSDALAGIISSFTTLTCCAQLFSNLIEKPGRHILTIASATLHHSPFPALPRKA